jgi:lipopolysaccharide heptosyltransferase I
LTAPETAFRLTTGLPNAQIPFDRILIIRLSALGDVVHCLPAFANLRAAFPKSRIAWAAEERVASLLQRVPGIDELFIFPRRSLRHKFRRPWLWPSAAAELLRTRARLKAFNPTVAFDFQGNLKSAMHAWMSGAPWRVGFSPAKERADRFYNVQVPAPGRVHRVERALDLLRALELPARAVRQRLNVDTADKAAIDAWLRQVGIRSTFAICHFGTSDFGSLKRWPLEYWGRLGALLTGDGLPVVFTWGPGEREAAERAAAITVEGGGRAIIGPVTPGLGTLAALISRATLFVGCDSGPLHLAATLGVAVVGLYGPKDPNVYGPYTDRHVVVWKGLRCSPCTRRTCPINDCMNFIAPEEVAQAASHLLSRKAPPTAPPSVRLA